MDLSYTPAEETFRARVRGWLAENLPETGSPRDLADSQLIRHHIFPLDLKCALSISVSLR